MTAAPKRHPFLDDLAEDVVFVSTILRHPVQGRDRVRQLVRAGAALYRNQTPLFLGAVGEHGFFEYEAELTTGGTATGLVSMLRNETGEVVRLHIAFSGLGEVLAIAAALREALGDAFGAELFL